MPVMDASAVMEILLRTRIGLHTLDRVMNDTDGMHAPHLLDVEVTHVLRRLSRAGELSERDAAFAVDTVAQLRIERHAHLVLLPRVWELRDALSAYDATYVALAESLHLPLMTRDSKLSRSHGHHATIELLS